MKNWSAQFQEWYLMKVVPKKVPLYFFTTKTIDTADFPR